MEKYLASSEIIDFHNPKVKVLAEKLAKDCVSDEQIVKNCFEYVRDEIKHIGDYPSDTKACTASEVLEKRIGICYAKAHLLAALTRANNIPTAFSYQRLSCSEYEKGMMCIHGLNAVYLKNHGWYRIDARGNREGVDAQFTPPFEKLAFPLQEGEIDIEGYFDEPLPCIVEHLNKYDKHKDILGKLPDSID